MLSQRLMPLVGESEIVQADETSLVMQKPFRRGFVWTFLTDEVIAYRFAPDRSGETPRAVLDGTRGIVRTPAHLKLRQTRGRQAMNVFLAWLEEYKDASRRSARSVR